MEYFIITTGIYSIFRTTKIFINSRNLYKNIRTIQDASVFSENKKLSIIKYNITANNQSLNNHINAVSLIALINNKYICYNPSLGHSKIVPDELNNIHFIEDKNDLEIIGNVIDLSQFRQYKNIIDYYCYKQGDIIYLYGREINGKFRWTFISRNKLVIIILILPKLLVYHICIIITFISWLIYKIYSLHNPESKRF